LLKLGVEAKSFIVLFVYRRQRRIISILTWTHITTEVDPPVRNISIAITSVIASVDHND
jgi:hypothetical protein